MDILRVTAVWTGFQGAPGYSNFHFAPDPGFWDGGIVGDDAEIAAQAAIDRVESAFSGIGLFLPDGVVIRVDGEVEVLDSDTGEILGAIEADGATRSGSGSGGGWSAASGAVVNWRTNDYRFGRRIRGRTFLVPLAGGAYQTDGTLSNGGLAAIRGFGNDMRDDGAAPAFGVWSRPRDGSGGVFANVTGSSVPDMAAVLRSRRD